MLPVLIPAITGIIDKVLSLIPDPNMKAKVEAEARAFAMNMLAEEQKDNREINKTEASHSSVFVSGWRPAIGWICACALGYQYIARPFVALVFPDAQIIGLDSNLWELMLGMLGLGSLRTVEKFTRKAR